MGQKIHFEDNIFFLNEIVRTLQRNLSLKPDPEFFFDRVKKDLTFLDTTLSRLFTILEESPHLINRQQYLRYLLKTMGRFTQLIDTLSSATLFDFSRYKGELLNIENNQRKNIQEINRLLFSSVEDDSEDHVSQEEFKHLFLENL